MKSLTAVLHARVLEAEIRQLAKGRDYLSLKAEPIEEKTANKVGAIWVTSFHKSHMAAGIKPGMQIRVEGPLDVQRYEKDGEQRITLWLTADGLTIAVDAAPKEVKCEAQKPVPLASAPADGQGSTSATQNDMQNGSVIDVFGPRNEPKLSRAEITELMFPAEKRGGKRHDRPFDDPIPF